MERATRDPPNAFLQALYVAREEVLAMLLSIRSLLLVICYGTIVGVIGWIIYWLDEQAGGKLASVSQKAAELNAAEKQMIIDQMVERGASSHLANAIVSGDLPPLVYVILYLSTISIQVLILLVGYNRISDDVQSRFVRYIFQRVGRGPYLAGKIIGHWAACFLSLLFVHGVLLAYGSQSEVFAVDRTLAAMPRIWIGLALFVLGYSGYTALFSATMPAPFAAFALGAMGLIALWFFTWIANLINGGWAWWNIWFGNWDDRLWALDPAAVGIYLGGSGVIIGLAYLGLLRRDV